MLWNSIGSITRLGCNYLITIIVVRLSTGYDAAGVLALAMSVNNLVAPFADFRLRTVHVTDVRGEHSASEYMGMRLLCTALCFVVGSIYAVITCALDAFPSIALYLLASLAANIIEGLHAVDQRHNRMDYIGISYIMQGISNLLLFSVVFGVTGSLELSLLSMFIATSLILLLFDIPHAGRLEIVRPALKLHDAIATLVGLSPLVMAQVLSSGVLTIPRQYLSSSMGAAALGIYASVASPAAVVQMGASYIYSPLLGSFAKDFRDDLSAAFRLLAKTSAAVAAVGAGCALLLLLLGDWVLALFFGSDIVQYSYLLQPAVLCTLITAYTWFMNDLLLTLRDYRACFTGSAVSIVATLICFKFMVDTFGMNGVSWTGVFSYALSVVTLFIFLFHDTSGKKQARGKNQRENDTSRSPCVRQ